MRNGLMEKLREETRLDHHAVERTSPFYTEKLDRTTYTDWLGRLYGFICPVEMALAHVPGWGSTGIDIQKRRKAHLLESDLETLGMSRAKCHTLQLCNDLPDLSTTPRALGCLYVIEGSTLGGRVIAARLVHVLPEVTTHAMAYFGSYGSSVSMMWRSFGEHVEIFAKNRNIDAEVIDAARASFRAFQRWMASTPPEGASK